MCFGSENGAVTTNSVALNGFLVYWEEKIGKKNKAFILSDLFWIRKGWRKKDTCCVSEGRFPLCWTRDYKAENSKYTLFLEPGATSSSEMMGRVVFMAELLSK